MKDDPWNDPDHPYIARVEGGWKKRERNGDEFVLFYINCHPVIYKLLGRNGVYRSKDAAHFRAVLKRFFDGEVISDEDIARIPDPGRWPKELRMRWPQLGIRH